MSAIRGSGSGYKIVIRLKMTDVNGVHTGDIFCPRSAAAGAVTIQSSG